MRNDQELARRAALTWLARQLAWERRLAQLRAGERPERDQQRSAA
jgi:hypothetical protein